MQRTTPPHMRLTWWSWLHLRTKGRRLLRDRLHRGRRMQNGLP